MTTRKVFTTFDVTVFFTFIGPQSDPWAVDSDKSGFRQAATSLPRRAAERSDGCFRTDTRAHGPYDDQLPLLQGDLVGAGLARPPL